MRRVGIVRVEGQGCDRDGRAERGGPGMHDSQGRGFRTCAVGDRNHAERRLTSSLQDLAVLEVRDGKADNGANFEAHKADENTL